MLFTVLSDEVPLVVSRQLLQTFAQELGKLEPETQKEIANYTLNQIQPRVVSFEEQVWFKYLSKVVFDAFWFLVFFQNWNYTL